MHSSSFALLTRFGSIVADGLVVRQLAPSFEIESTHVRFIGLPLLRRLGLQFLHHHCARDIANRDDRCVFSACTSLRACLSKTDPVVPPVCGYLAVFNFSQVHPGENVFASNIAEWGTALFSLSLATNIIVTTLIGKPQCATRPV